MPQPSKRRSATTGTMVGTRIKADLLQAIDTWRRTQPDLPTRPEAVRRLVEAGMNYEKILMQDDERKGFK